MSEMSHEIEELKSDCKVRRNSLKKVDAEMNKLKKVLQDLTAGIVLIHFTVIPLLI